VSSGRNAIFIVGLSVIWGDFMVEDLGIRGRNSCYKISCAKGGQTIWKILLLPYM
jgi:hypothetical protein